MAGKYAKFSEMPDDALRALANDLANPKEAMKRIRASKSWWCDQCSVEVRQLRCVHCGKSEREAR